MRNKITQEEFWEIFRKLEEAGWEPQLCNRPVPYIDSGVQAGKPTDNGDYTRGEVIILPEELVWDNSTFIISVKGESMKDADILPGDRVQILTGTTVKDGDIVIASLDGGNTLKAFFTDERGNKWLVPYNDAFKPMLLTEEMKVNIVGKVVCVMKDYQRLPYMELLNKVQEERNRVAPQRKKITLERVEQVIRDMGNEVEQVRQWYAVFRAMVDLEVLTECDYDPFVEKVKVLLPTHNRLPVTGELRRMASDSFRKPVEKWQSNDAPVSGYRFDNYLKIAKLTKAKLLR